VLHVLEILTVLAIVRPGHKFEIDRKKSQNIYLTFLQQKKNYVIRETCRDVPNFHLQEECKCYKYLMHEKFGDTKKILLWHHK